LEEVTQLMTL